VSVCRVPSQGITQAPWDSLPVYLCRFAVRSPFWIPIEVFLGSLESLALWPEGLDITPQRYGAADLPAAPAYTLEPALPIAGRAILLRHPWIISSRRYGNINPFPIDYAFRPRLRDRLTLSGLTFLRKP
jgi:hypothetical protein